MSRYVRCPDCHRMFRGADRLANHANWHPFNHPKANRAARRHKAAERKKARRQTRSIRRDLAAHKRAQGVS